MKKIEAASKKWKDIPCSWIGRKTNTGKFYKIFKNLIPILLKLFQKIEEVGNLPNTFNKASVTLIPKPDKDNTKKESHKNPQLNISKTNPTTY